MMTTKRIEGAIMAKRKRPTEVELIRQEASARDQIGLTAAHAGDENGVRRFAYLMESEVGSIAFFSKQPEPVKIRLRVLQDTLRDLKNFMDGRLSVSPKAKR
jgi:hypothetical protein